MVEKCCARKVVKFSNQLGLQCEYHGGTFYTTILRGNTLKS